MLLMTTALFAQEKVSVIKLKSGTEVRGTIVEKSAGGAVSIKTPEGDVFVYQASEIANIESPNVPKPGKAVDWSVRYRGEVNVGYAITGANKKWKEDYNYEGTSHYYDYDMKTVLSRPLFETVHGVEIGPYFFVGAGVGLQYFCGKMKDAGEEFFGDESVTGSTRWNALMLPIFADIKLMYPVNDKFTPFINLGLGGTIGLASSVNESNIDYTARTKGGFYCDFGAGFRYKALNFSLGMMHQTFAVVYEGSGWNEWGEPYEWTDRYFTKFASFYLKLGVNF